MTRAVLVISVCAGAAGAQPQRPIDQGYADTSTVQTSLKVQPIDLRRPTGFGNVYRVPGSDSYYSRSDGALTAVFQQSSYIPTENSVHTPVPAGTLFVIGQMPPEYRGGFEQTPTIGGSNRVGLGAIDPGPRRVSHDPTDHFSRTVATRIGEEPTIWNNSRYRQHRTEHLLTLAVQAE